MSKRLRQLDELDRLDAVAALLDEDYAEHDMILLGDESIQCAMCTSTVDIVDIHAPDWDAEIRRVEQCVVLHINRQSHASAVDPVIPEGCPIVINGVRVVCPSFLLDVAAMAGPGRTLYSVSLAALLIPTEEGNIRIHAFHIYELVELEIPDATSRPPSDAATAAYSCSIYARHYTPTAPLATLKFLDTFPRRYPTDSDWHIFNFNRRAEAVMAQQTKATHRSTGTPTTSTQHPRLFRPLSKDEAAYWARFRKEEKQRLAKEMKATDAVEHE